MTRDVEGSGGLVVEIAKEFDFGVNVFKLTELLGVMEEVGHEVDGFLNVVWGGMGNRKCALLDEG
jgi:hypothetical protein